MALDLHNYLVVPPLVHMVAIAIPWIVITVLADFAWEVTKTNI